MRAIIYWVALTACGPSDRDTPAADGPSQPDPDAPPIVDPSRVYAHSGQNLYQMNSATLATTNLATFSGLGNQSLTDLAVDKNDRMLGITLDKLYEIDIATGAATLIRDLSQDADNVTSLSFVPADLNDPASADILVTANSFGEVFEIDPSTGSVTMIGNYGSVAQGQVRSSGDLFGVRGVGIFATVDVGDNGGNDYLARIDPVTWAATPLGTGTGFDKIFGVGFWGGKIYGFVDLGASNGGQMIEIDQNTGAGTLLSASSIRWFGAGVATDAPILE
jgi:hypothetical protein